ncbi:MAG TPA: 50S ribosomal protein L23 [Nitrososphaeraceae archaeon]|jgi:large subunit ribosomal protein L23|nr:50S ribosomal protein L23 [Nitrososphaeraceae archaeon]
MKGKRKNENAMSAEKASSVFIQPYVTEKTFNVIEKENKLTFIVSESSTKREILEAMRLVYEADTSEVNTAKTIRGKKAIIKFRTEGGARDLATRLGLV